MNQINALPKGYISTKKIGGNIYYYHQWTENGKKYSKYLSQEELEKLNPLIEERQKLEQELKDIKRGYSDEDLISYTLMHLNVKVIDLFIDRESGLIRSFGSLYSPEHLPLGAIDEKGFFNNRILIEWWNDRSIPLSRSGIKEALEKLDINNPQSLLIKCYGLSLSDQYWIKPKDEIISWEEINFFDNAFSDDVGEILLGGERKKDELNLSSPDNTSVGNLKKKWKISGNKRVMIKGGSAPFRQEPFNEVIAYKVAKELDINCIEYKAFYVDGYPYSECEDFISKDSDLITAYQRAIMILLTPIY